MAELWRSKAGAITPERCYRDAPAAIAFLELAFGFTPSLVVPGIGDHAVAHAELWNGEACVMLASLPGEPWRYRSPGEIGGVNTGSPYIATPNIDACYARAVGAGCTIVSELRPTDYGSRDFSALDREGFLWHFGTYRPETDAALPEKDEAEPQIYCGMRYSDARAAMAWLTRAFGAIEQFVVPGEGNEIAHAQMLLGDGLVMLGSDRTDSFNLRTPLQIGGDYTQTLNVYVSDPDAHQARALAAGAEVITPLADTPYGARVYVARDCDGYLWSFGTYRPVAPAHVESAAVS